MATLPDDYELTFYYPTQAAPSSTVTFRGPDFGNVERIDRQQVVQDTPANELIVFDRGPTTYFLDFDCSKVDRTDLDNLITFFDTIQGAKYTFEVRVPRYDDLDSSKTPNGGRLYAGCQWDSGPLEHAETDREGRYSIAFRLRSTGRTNVS